jgi:hypothetical protein
MYVFPVELAMGFGFFERRMDDGLWLSAGPGPVSLENASRAVALKEALVCEAHSLTLQIATLTSGINSLADAGIKAGPVELKAFAPIEPDSLPVLMKMLQETGTGFDEPLFLTEMLAGLKVGMALLDAYFDDAAQIGAARAGVLHKTGLSASWQQICHLAIIALKELDAEIAPDLPEIYVQNSRVLTSLLTAAKNGWRPCVDRDGNLYTPPLPQQRRWPRRALLQDCVIVHKGARLPAFARDISAGGMGLDRMPAVTRGDIIGVELSCGRRLTGVVAWSSGESVGLRLCTRLKSTDPLLVA